ncbi:hypothetical protein RRG08_043527 [Elysia crispata]|uniref:Uncharacterized protein n=1 Tax=Elysia crispata TaxID=231223 RepID=A0AAE0YFN0_9GAST|nr:hypothetical protein RRG08_043527 [Elysia crispata]
MRTKLDGSNTLSGNSPAETQKQVGPSSGTTLSGQQMLQLLIRYLPDEVTLQAERVVQAQTSQSQAFPPDD